MWRSILFGRTPGYYLFWSGFVYFWVGMYDIFVYRFAPPEILSMAWMAVLCLPWVVPPVGRWFNMHVRWDMNFLEWMGLKKVMDDTDPKNVIKFPPVPPRVVPPVPAPEPPATTFYRLGITSNGRVSFQMGHSEITMNADGIDNMIKQLQVFRDQIQVYEDDDGEPDGK